jgi:hypothetical protein
MFRSPLGRSNSSISISAGAALLGAVGVMLSAPSAGATPGYEPDPVKPSIALGAEVPSAVAIDQATQQIYVAELTTDSTMAGHGQIEQLSASGTPTANSPFVTGAGDYYTGVAVNPVNQDLFAYQTELQSPTFGSFGAPRLDVFSSAGVLKSSFTTTRSSGPQIAADAAGRIYYPNDSIAAIQVFNSSGTLQETISCSACPGGAFDELKGVALDSAGNLYAVDVGGERAIKFKSSAGTYVYDSVLQSGRGAVAVGVDPTSNDVFVGDLNSNGYHVVAYDSSGVQFDDFGGQLFGTPTIGAIGAGQIAVNATTRKVYVTDPSSANVVRVFNRIASIPAPTATTSPPSPLGQLEATLKATVNPKGHGLTECHFEYTDDVDFEANAFANAVSLPCASLPNGPSATTASVPLAGLTPSTSYDYRILVASNGGTAEGSALEFTTLPPLPPVVTTGAASAIAQTKATIAGTVNPRGGPISNCHFEFTDEADFQLNGFAKARTGACSPAKPVGNAATTVTAKITGLVASTAYRFRAVATNNSGTAEATDQKFATLADTCATNPVLCPPPPLPPQEESTSLPPVVPFPPSPPATTPTKKPLKCRKGFRKKRVHGKLRCVKIKKRRR